MLRRRSRKLASVEPFAPRDVAEIDLSGVEVKQLWFDLSGSSVMDASIRRRMVRSWGPCPRHAWAQAIVEIELRGGVPFTIAILYADLVGRAVGAIRTDDVRQALLPRDVCVTCDYCRFADLDPAFEQRTKRANERQRTRALLAASQRQWQPAICPACQPGRTGPPCRPHLIAGADLPDELPTHLEQLQARLQHFQKSMTWHGPVATPADRASWVEALGFFAGWSAPLTLAR